jgi:hypothetical protein
MSGGGFFTRLRSDLAQPHPEARTAALQPDIGGPARLDLRLLPRGSERVIGAGILSQVAARAVSQRDASLSGVSVSRRRQA